MQTITVSTRSKTELVDITPQVQEAVRDSGVTEGVCYLFVPHTTAGIVVNENWDPSVGHDIVVTLNDVAPHHPRHRHTEGNSPAHIKSALCGASATLFVSNGQLMLGSWQGVFLAEFDGPRHRKVWIKVIPDRA